MRHSHPCTGIRIEKRHDSGTGHNLYRRAGSHQTDGLGGASHWPTVCAPRQKEYRPLLKPRPGIVIEIRWCPVPKGVAGNEKVGEWATTAVEEKDAHGLEWLNYSDRTEVRARPLPRSLANVKREISEKKWAEAQQWAGGRTSTIRYKMPKSHKPDGTVAESTKRLASS